MARTGLSPRTSATLLACDREDLPAAALLCALLESDQGRHEGDVTGLLEKRGSNKDEVLALAGLMLARAQRSGQHEERQRPDFARAARALQADPCAAGRILLPGWADRLALVKSRDDGCARALTRQGTGVLVPCQGQTRFVLALETTLPDAARSTGTKGAFGRVSLFCPVDEESVRVLARESLERRREVRVQENGSVLVSQRLCLDALVLEEQRVEPGEEDREIVRDALCAFVLEHDLACLPWDRETQLFCERASFLARVKGDPWPHLGKDELKGRWQEWLADLCSGITDLRTLRPGDLYASLRGLLPWQCLAEIEKLAPSSWTSPCGKRHPIRYDEVYPCVEVKLQECFGLTKSPLLAGDTVLTLHLLSPGGARLASTRDLPFFWKEVYPRVRSEMRGRYPRHPWPEDPLAALPTTLTQKALRARKLI